MNNKKQLKHRNVQCGFSMVTSLVGVAILSGVIIGGVYLHKDIKEDQVAKARGVQIGSGLDRLEDFARKYQTQLNAGQSVSGVASTSAPTTAELRNLGFAATGFDDSSQPGGAIIYRIDREPVGCVAAKCTLVLKAGTSTSVRINGTPDAAFAQRIAGHVPRGAGWSNTVNNAATLTKAGMTLPNPLGNTPAVVFAISWLGSSTASTTTPPPVTETKNVGCPSGWSGTHRQSRVKTTDKWGNVTYTSWKTTTNTCKAPPPPPPPDPPPTPPVVTDPPVTPPPPPVGPTCTTGSWTNNYGCPSGWIGQKYSTSYRTCPNGPNGAHADNEGPVTDTCTPPVPPPPPPKEDPPAPSGCHDIYGSPVSVGTVMGVCNATGSPDGYPSGRTMRCTASGWQTANSGNSNRPVDCP